MVDVEQLLDTYRSLIDPYAKAKSKRNYLEEYKKSLIAIQMKVAEQNGSKTVSAQERDAYASNEYIEMLESIKNLTEEEESLRYRIRQLEMEIEVWRSQQANERQERKAYNF